MTLAKPICFQSNPSYQERAENCCNSCLFQHECFELDLEELLERLYWEFDTQRNKGTYSERDVFKGKLRFLLNKVGVKT